MAIKEIADPSKWRIVSGSVILDPRYAVKELLDNAIDGGADNIYIDVDARTSGCHYISVRDDGSGVSESDRSSMCLNYSTSKIESLEDLSHLSSLGFRGQALFSLANLANQKGSMQITTRTKFEKVGEKWLVDKNGHVREGTRKKVPCPPGTSVVIRNLLLGLKARYIHTSSRAPKNNEEIHRLINHYALDFRSIRFHFHLVSIEKTGEVNKRQLQGSIDTNISRARALSAIAKLKNAVSKNFLVKDDLLVTNLIHLDVILPTMESQEESMSLRRPKRFLSVNNRAMSLQLNFGNSIKKIIDKIYRTLNLPDPVAWFINLKCDPKLLDLNIEPGKDDIMIKNMDFIVSEIEKCLFRYISEAAGGRETNEEDVARIYDRPAELGDGLSDADLSEVAHPIPYGGERRNASQGSGESLDRSSDKSPERASDTFVHASPRTQDSEDSTPRLGKRLATADLRSPDDGRWRLNLTPNDRIDSQDLAATDEASFLAHGFDRPHEGVVLSRDASISNPSMTAKVRKIGPSSGRSQDNGIRSFGRDQESLPIARPREKFNGEGIRRGVDEISKFTNVQRHPECAVPNVSHVGGARSSSNNTILVDRRIDEGERVVQGRRIGLVSEDTKGWSTKMQYDVNKLWKEEYKEELKWLAREGDPSRRLSASLMRFSGFFKNKQPQLSRANDGWFTLTL